MQSRGSFQREGRRVIKGCLNNFMSEVKEGPRTFVLMGALKDMLVIVQ